MNNEVNLEEIAKDLLWRYYISHKHEGSNYFIVDSDEDSSLFEKGKIYKYLWAESNIHPSSYHELTWKDLLWELNINRKLLVSDTHDCKICPNRNKCTALFKDDPDQEQCSYWIHEISPVSVFKPDYKNQTI